LKICLIRGLPLRIERDVFSFQSAFRTGLHDKRNFYETRQQKSHMAGLLAVMTTLRPALAVQSQNQPTAQPSPSAAVQSTQTIKWKFGGNDAGYLRRPRIERKKIR
jgi:hypothetical protein